MEDCIYDGLIDTLKILPYLFVTFIILELIEHKLSKKNQKVLANNKRFGPVIGGFLGALPQCGFSTMAANLFSSRVITMGTVIAVFLSTSDEMIPIMLSEQVNVLSMLNIVLLKVVIGIIVGIVVDLIYRSNDNKTSKEIKNMCEEEKCSCDKDGIVISTIKHTFKIGLFILIANLLINIIIFEVGENNLSNILTHNNIITYFLASLIGLIPNCASSVIMTELYLSNIITIGNLLSGLLTGSGLGILLLFKSNKKMKENIVILSVVYLVGVIVGILVDIII